ncbi:MAG: ATP-binding protein, partial [Mucilaginibacter sp.]
IYAILMERTQNTGEEILHYKISKNIGKQIRFIRRILYADVHLGPTYLELGKNDSARMFAEEASRLALQLNEHNYLGNILGCMGDIALKTGALAKAKQYYYEGASEDEANGNIYDLTNNYLKITNFYLGAGQKDSSLHYALKTLKTFRTLGPTTGLQVNIGLAYELLYKSYQLRRQTDSAYKYSTLTLAAKDSVNRSRLVNLSDFQNLSLKEQMRVQYLEKEKVIYQARIRTYAMLIALLVLLIIALIFYRNYRHKQKANKILENTLAELKSTQTQLVQREKMASLGELTAGIAHEIQNPLNFVNNFSEVSAELVDEMEQELDKGEVEEAKAIANDVKQNLEKIRHHGKRADAIVKGMLEHSRVGTGERVPSDINVLAEEFMRLSYHGLRAKDKEFNAELVTNFDAGLPKANVVPQDISRVLLNLFNNAFYAVNQKMKTGGPDYKPMVEVSTFVPPSGGWGLKVKDNGNGIPDDIKEKIMQPFFTTKPTGEGTGLGLSLSYDIVVKGHGGIISVNSVEGEGTEFIITIP